MYLDQEFRTTAMSLIRVEKEQEKINYDRHEGVGKMLYIISITLRGLRDFTV